MPPLRSGSTGWRVNRITPPSERTSAAFVPIFSQSVAEDFAED
jgi:hypothetical protein